MSPVLLKPGSAAPPLGALILLGLIVSRSVAQREEQHHGRVSEDSLVEGRADLV